MKENDIVETFIKNFMFVSSEMLDDETVKNNYKSAPFWTKIMVGKYSEKSLTYRTLDKMKAFWNNNNLNINWNFRSPPTFGEVDITLMKGEIYALIPVEVENNSDDENEIFDSEIPKLLSVQGELMVLITYDYNEYDRQINNKHLCWRNNFISKLDNTILNEKVNSPFLLILGNTPNKLFHHKSDCNVNWLYWIKYPSMNGKWYKP